jgi:hypothetical protein
MQVKANTHIQQGGGNADLLQVLGQQPDGQNADLLALQQGQEIPQEDFAKLLQMQQGQVGPDTLLSPEQQMEFQKSGKLPDGVTLEMLQANVSAEGAQAVNPELMSQHGKLPLESAQGDVAKLLANSKMGTGEPVVPFVNRQTGEVQVLEDPKALDAKNKNAEDASRQFMPERSSIFDMSKAKAKRQSQQANLNKGLLNLNDFISKQGPSVQKRMDQTAYKNEMQQSMLDKKIESKLPAVKSISAHNNVMEMMLQQEVDAVDRNLQMTPQTAKALDIGGNSISQAPKVFDMNTMANVENRDGVINQIQDYIVQAKAANEPKVEMSFKHQDLGQIDLQVLKSGKDHISISIGANSAEGMKFFTQNQGELLTTLSNAGLKVADFKLDSSAQNNDFSQNFDQGRGRHEGAGDQRQQESKKREELWNLMKDRKEAA